jgi:hypothetical protein
MDAWVSHRLFNDAILSAMVISMKMIMLNEHERIRKEADMDGSKIHTTPHTGKLVQMLVTKEKKLVRISRNSSQWQKHCRSGAS